MTCGHPLHGTSSWEALDWSVDRRLHQGWACGLTVSFPTHSRETKATHSLCVSRGTSVTQGWKMMIALLLGDILKIKCPINVTVVIILSRSSHNGHSIFWGVAQGTAGPGSLPNKILNTGILKRVFWVPVRTTRHPQNEWWLGRLLEQTWL